MLYSRNIERLTDFHIVQAVIFSEHCVYEEELILCLFCIVFVKSAQKMWTERIQELIRRSPKDFECLRNEQDPTTIFEKLKKNFLEPENWENIAEIFSPIILHLVSEIVLDVISNDEEDDLPIIVLLANLIRTFPAIQPVVMQFIERRPVALSPHIGEELYLQAVFRLLTALDESFEIQGSAMLALLENHQLSETALFYLINIISIIRQSSEQATAEMLNEIPQELQVKLFDEEKKFAEKRIQVENYGPMKFTTRFATTVDGIPFLRSFTATESTDDNPLLLTPHARSLALAMLTNKPVMIVGPTGSGKSTIIQHLASLAGVEVVSLHLGANVDSKSILGGLICGEMPGEFKWLDGPLTAAIRSNDKWIVFEQIEEANKEVQAIITSLLSEKKLFIPSSSETIKIGYNTKIFATCFQPTDSSLWTKMSVDFLPEDVLKQAIFKAHPSISALIDRIVNSWNACGKLSYHELFRLCRTLETFKIVNDHVTDVQYIAMYQATVDVFTSHLPSMKKRLENAVKIAKVWDLQEKDAEAYLQNQKPTLNLNTDELMVGNVRIPVLKPENSLRPSDFAPTFSSLHNMESVARALSIHQPVLLIGETGTGKTTLVQFIASCIGADFTVINMHHQSDSLDIVGGFKPIQLEKLLLPMRNKVIELFKKTLDPVKNASTIVQITTTFENKSWSDFLKTIIQVANTIMKRNEKKPFEPAIVAQWEEIRKQAKGYKSKKEFLDRGYAFGFVEGPLTTAFRTGQWILLDEVNLAPDETLLSLAPIIDGALALPNGDLVFAHENFRLICCMNPATDVGKTNLPETLVHKFVSIYSDETSSEQDIKLILTTRNVNSLYHDKIYQFYTKARELSKTKLKDSSGKRLMYSLRALTRSINYMNKAEKYFGPARSCYEGLQMSFISPLSPETIAYLRDVLDDLINPSCLKDAPKYKPEDGYLEIEGFLIEKGKEPIVPRDDFILTEAARQHLRGLTQAVFLGKNPILLQGPTSSGKTSIVKYLADITGHKFVRINNHENTDISEYIGQNTTTESGGFVFTEGTLVKAVREGAWVVLDELNLAPSAVLEALNRLLDQNNQLFIAETNEVVNPGEGFQLFATQNPPGVYGGRKELSRAFRGRFIEMHIDEIPPRELKQIIVDRCHIAPSFADAMINIFLSLRRQRQSSNIFSGKQAFLTVRDLLRWANRGPSTWEELADQGFAILGERLRTKEERIMMMNEISSNCKKVQVFHEFEIPPVNLDFEIVWTSGMRRSVDLILRCIHNNEPVLLVGETGTGKTTAVQVVAAMLGRKLRILNCHQHTESSDFLGAMRPAKPESQKLFEWVDGSLVEAMVEGDMYLMDEISLAQDSALERLNPVLEPERKLPLAEKPGGGEITAHENFAFIATMNPGGDYGKRELSPSLRNRFTEIWVPSIDSDEDLLEILAANSKNQETAEHGQMFLDFVRAYTSSSRALVNISLRDILQWVRFVDSRVSSGSSFADAYVHGAFMVFIDCVFTSNRQFFIDFLQNQIKDNSLEVSEKLGEFSHDVVITEGEMKVGAFTLKTGPNFREEESPFVFSAPTTSQNLLRVARALQMHLPVLIEGPPGVGKTSLVASLGAALGFNVVRINLSEHTEMLDLVGSELPVENGKSGAFQWRDGAFLTALKNGDWVILDELNLASQSVLEGLNSCLDHRASLYVPELDTEFKCHPEFRIFGCQNPAAGGGGRKSLPRSFLNRFTRVYVEELTAEDFDYIIKNTYKDEINPELRTKMINFIYRLNNLHLDFEFNLRDVFRWCEMIKSAGIQPVKALRQLFVQRLREEKHRKEVLKIAHEEFGDFSTLPTPMLLTPTTVHVGDIILDREGTCQPTDLVIHPALINPLETVFMCARMKWPGLLVGGTATAKSSLVRMAAHILGRKLVEFSMNSSVDTTELLGGFEQMDNSRCFQQLRAKIQHSSQFNAETLHNFELITEPDQLYDFVKTNEELFSPEIVQEAESILVRSNDPGKFEWVDGLLLQAMRNGWWIIIDNANICPPAVLDRLNPLCEPGGYISLNERGLVNDDIEDIHPHENFRLFMTVNPQLGEVSRAMRNRAIELYLPSFYERITNKDPLLMDECRALAGEYGEEFLAMVKDCQDNDRRIMTPLNMLSFKNFKEQASVCQLGEDAAHFDIAHCELTDAPTDERKMGMTRSNSSMCQFQSSDRVLSTMRFLPMTNTVLSQVYYDAAYLLQKGLNNAAIKFFVGSTRKIDLEARLIFAKQWGEVYEVMNRLRNDTEFPFVGELPADKTLWPRPEETLSFTAYYLTLTTSLDRYIPSSNTIDSDSIRAYDQLVNLVDPLYTEIEATIKSAIDTDSVTAFHTLIIRLIEFFNGQRKNTESDKNIIGPLPVFRFLRSLIKQGKINIPYLEKIEGILCPNNSKEAKRLRSSLGEPFTFKDEKLYSLWKRIKEYCIDLIQESDAGFYRQSPKIIHLLSTIIKSMKLLNADNKTEAFENILQTLKQVQLPKETVFQFLDEVDEYDQTLMKPTIIKLSCPFPRENLTEISYHSVVLYIFSCIRSGAKITLPKTYSVPLDLLAIIDSYNTGDESLTDLLYATYELLIPMEHKLLTGPGIPAINAVLGTHTNLLETAHSKELLTSMYTLLKRIPSFDLDDLLYSITSACNKEAEKLGIPAIALDIENDHVVFESFRKQFINFTIQKWKKISPLGEVDDSFYHSVVSEITTALIDTLKEEKEVTAEIMESRIGNREATPALAYDQEIDELRLIANKSIKKSKYRANPEDYSNIKAIVKSVTGNFDKFDIESIVQEETKDVSEEDHKKIVERNNNIATSINQTATTLGSKEDFREIVVPLTTTLRQIAFAITMDEPETVPELPYPFVSQSLFGTIKKLFDTTIKEDGEDVVVNNFFIPKFASSIIGHVPFEHPKIEMEFKTSGPDYSTISEEEKQAKQIEELFSKEKKDKLNVIATHFINSILHPENASAEKLLNMLCKQVEKLDLSGKSFRTDLYYMPLMLYRISTKKYEDHHNINIYQKSSFQDLEEVSKIVYKIIELTIETWKRYPGHEQLRRIIKAADTLMKMPSDAPLNDFLISLEMLMGEIREWQYKERDYHDVLRPLVALANKWLKMRLESWKYLFESRRKKIQENIGQNFYTIMEQLKITSEENIDDFFALACDIIDKSAVGALSTNLDMLEAIAIYSTRFDNGHLVYPILINLVTKFRSYNQTINNYIQQELTPLEKTMKEYMDLQKWDADSDKKHMLHIDNVKRQLNKYCQQHLTIIQPIFRLMIDQFTTTIFRTPEVPYEKEAEVSSTAEDDETKLLGQMQDIIRELFDSKVDLKKRIYDARIFANRDLEVSGARNAELQENSKPVQIFKNPVLRGSEFDKVNDLFGTALSLLTKIRKSLTDKSDGIPVEDATDLMGICENLVLLLIHQRKDLSPDLSEYTDKPQFYTEGPKFVLSQIIAILDSFAKIDNNNAVADVVKSLVSYRELQTPPIEDVCNALASIKGAIASSYIQKSMDMFVDRSIEAMMPFKNYKAPEKKRVNREAIKKHLNYCRFVVAFMKQTIVAILDGYGQNNDENNDEPQEQEGQDGTGLGEGVGDEDITNEIDDENQLEGDNVNTNNDKQDENDVDREGGFEMEQDMPEDAPDVSAGEEEEKGEDMDDEMGETKDGDQVNERDATDDTKEADKEADVEREDTKENKQADNKEEEDKNDDQNEDEKEEPNDEKSGEISMSDEEDQFESDAAQWNEEPEQLEMPEDQDHLLDEISDATEGEAGEEEEEVIEKPEDIENIKDEFLGQTAAQRQNKEEEDAEEHENIEGEGDGEEKGTGEKGKGSKDKPSEEEDVNESKEEETEEQKQQKELDEIEKQLNIVDKEILEGETQEGDEGGEKDENGTENVILPAEDAQEIPEEKKENEEEEEKKEDEQDENKGGAPAQEEGEFIKTEETEEEREGKVSMDFKIAEEEANKEAEKTGTGEIEIYQRNINEEARQRWQDLLNLTHDSAAELCEHLRLVLEATVAAKMRGDFRTGKRLNMRKIIPFIASGFRKDKIWMRRVQPDQRNYQVMLAIDNSASMAGKTGELALQSVSLITQALSLLSIGDLCVTKFGEKTEIVHKLGEKWNDESGAAVMEAFTFNEDGTKVDDMLAQSITYFEQQGSTGRSTSMQLCFIISDGILNNRDKVRELIIQAQLRRILIVFVVIDQPAPGRTSILQMSTWMPDSKGRMIVSNTMDLFPFPFYIVIQDPESLPERLSDALKQWFDLANSNQ